jgi:hypothetical protein
VILRQARADLGLLQVVDTDSAEISVAKVLYNLARSGKHIIDKDGKDLTLFILVGAEDQLRQAGVL